MERWWKSDVEGRSHDAPSYLLLNFLGQKRAFLLLVNESGPWEE